jgi:hypothetical protein
MGNPIREKWKSVESSASPPRRLRHLEFLSFEKFRENVFSQDRHFADSMIDSLYQGDCYILENAFPPESLVDLKQRTHSYGKKSESSYHKILDGCPNYHAIVDKQMGPADGYEAIDHSYYFFRWNDDPLELYSFVKPLWDAVKLLGGFAIDEYEGNMPSNGVIDRIQVHHYPRGAGKISTHSDPFNNQKVIAGAMLTEPGKDYESGGFYILDQNKEKQIFESKIKLGSVVMAYPSLLHGVETVDPQVPADWSSIEGRWYMSVFSVDSHHVENRTTALAPGNSF